MKIKQNTLEQPIGQRRNQREMRKYLKTNKNKNTTYYNLYNVAKAVLRGKFKVIKMYMKNKERFYINNLTLH